jgi:CHAT domain-containing protein/tetratricopeptide (TPR) repeat protein
MSRLFVIVAVLCLVPAGVGAADLKGVGSEAAVGANATGEACRIRVVHEEPARGSQRLHLYCDGWSVSSGTLFRFRVGRDTTAERLLIDSQFQKSYDTRLGGCGAVEATTLADGTTAALRQCTWLERGWPVVVMTAVAGGRGIALETFPTNVRVLEPAIGALRGKAVVGGAGDGTQSAAIRRAETIVGASGKLIGIQDIGAAETLWRLGKLHYRAGNYGSGEATFTRLLEIHDRLLGPDRPGAAPILSEIALCVGHQGRYDEADRVFARADKAAGASLAEEHLVLYAYRGSVHRDHKPEQALRWVEQAVRLGERYAESSHARAYVVGMHAIVLRSNKRHAEAEAEALKSLRMAGQPGNDADWRLWWVGEMHELLGRIYREQGRFADARREHELGLARRELLFGESSPRTIEGHAALGFNEQSAGNRDTALTHYRRAAALQLKHRAALEGARLPSILGYLDALVRTADARPAERPALAAEMFTALQIPRGNETAKALRAMSARVGSGDPRLAALTRDLQDSERRRTAARVALAEESMKPPDQRAARPDDLQRRLREVEDRIEALENQLQAEFPRYARLTAERPLPAGEVRALLRADEALVAMLSGVQSTFVVVVRSERVHYHRARIGRSGLDTEIKALRESLDLAADPTRAFDVARARRLYDTLLGPIAPALAGARHLLTVPSGPLLSLPLGVLVTRDAPAGGDDRAVPFLANDVGISVLPSVAALRELRAIAARSPAPQPFIGFADPAFSGSGADRRNVIDVANLCRRGETLDPALLRGLPRLSESADEVRRIAAALGAGADAVVVGAATTERRVRDTDLARYRVVAFATHGLLPGELRCQAEPALALTPPAAPATGEDGLLDASEVATLKLDADWVVLSACNTAGPDGSLGGESLSGLTRAFFYAGARALLVSHWAVASGPTVDLTTATFGVYAREPGLGKSEALRRAQAALRARPETAHPFYWAAFVLVGDGGATAGR